MSAQGRRARFNVSNASSGNVYSPKFRHSPLGDWRHVARYVRVELTLTFRLACDPVLSIAIDRWFIHTGVAGDSDAF